MKTDRKIDEELKKAIDKYAKEEAQKAYSFSKAFKWFTIGFCTCTTIVDLIQLFNK